LYVKLELIHTFICFYSKLIANEEELKGLGTSNEIFLFLI